MQRNQVKDFNTNLKQFLSLNFKQKKYQNIDLDLNFQYQPLFIKKITYDFTLKTAYNLSTNIEVYNSNNSQDKQLIYTPHYKLVFKGQITYKEFTFTYLHNYTGYVFTSRDNENFLPSFNLGRLFLSFRVKLKNNSVKIFYKIINLYNTNYQVVMNRPMPLINHEIGINFKINK